jgi:hypothetical protein
MTDTTSTFTDSDGNVHTVTHTTTVDPDTGETTVTDSHEVTFVHDSADGSHAAGSSETVFHEATTDTQGNTTTTDGVKGTDAEGNTSQTDSSTDSNTGLTTVVTTTTDAAGDGTTHVTMVDGAGNTVVGPDGEPLDTVEDVHPEPGGDEEPDLVPPGTDGSPSTASGHGEGSEDVDLEDDDPFFGQPVVKADEEDD